MPATIGGVIGGWEQEELNLLAFSSTPIKIAQFEFSREIFPNIQKTGLPARGFVLGKFMPLHKGHEAMIQYGIDNCEELTVLVCSLPTEPIDGELRYEWVKKRFPQARVLHCKDILPQEPHEHPLFWSIWKQVIQKYHPEELDVIFGSEDYVETLAKLMECKAKVFDKARKIIPISGTMVRNDPMKYWDYINEDVQKYFRKKVLIVGTESNGKSTLTENLAAHYGVYFMEEYARTYIDNKLDGDMSKLTYEHFDVFSTNHRILEEMKRDDSDGKVFFTDTDAITTLIFSREWYGQVSKTVLDLANSEKYDLILLCHPDVTWVDDGQRNLSHKRWELHEQFVHEFRIRGMEWVDVKGNWVDRWEIARKSVDKLLGQV